MATAPATQPPARVGTVFVGLALGMLLASVSMTVVAPAMPRIVAELGGLERYSWIALSAMLVSTVVTPIVGKLSDLFGRKPFYVGGIVLLMAGSVLSGLAPSFEGLIVARAVQGAGMGTMMPLAQAIVGDLIAPRERGKYQGILGAVFGLASIVGPFLGGYITDNLSWRWLFFVNLPVGVVALAFIVPFMHLPHARRPHTIDYAGIATLSLGLTALLLATVSGGTSYPWFSVEIVSLYLAAAVLLVAFVVVERTAPEPVLPLGLWRNRVFTFANLANMAVAMSMFGAIFFVPVFIQGVLGNSATESGTMLIPMTVAMIGTSILSGLAISRTGRYKLMVLGGTVLMGVGFYLLTLMDALTPDAVVVRNVVVIGLGLGVSMQTYTLIVQNAVDGRDLGVATAATQLFRSIGSTVGIAVFGTLMAQTMATAIPRRLPPELAARAAQGGSGLGAGAALDPAALAQLPPAALEAIRGGMAEALQTVFLAGLPFVVLAFLATLLIDELPLRRTPHAAADAGKELLAELNQAGPDDAEPVLDEVAAPR